MRGKGTFGSLGSKELSICFHSRQLVGRQSISVQTDFSSFLPDKGSVQGRRGWNPKRTGDMTFGVRSEPKVPNSSHVLAHVKDSAGRADR